MKITELWNNIFVQINYVEFRGNRQLAFVFTSEKLYEKTKKGGNLYRGKFNIHVNDYFKEKYNIHIVKSSINYKDDKSKVLVLYVKNEIEVDAIYKLPKETKISPVLYPDFSTNIVLKLTIPVT